MTVERRAGGHPPAPERLLKIPEVAERLQVCQRTVFRLVKAGELPVMKIGRSVRIRPSDLEAFIKRSGMGVNRRD